ncbi:MULTISPECIES: hypothetical protein [unclassified Mesorhizobium]|uniref:hypothetical protein n=1 Tax=unclassified Mesorhizobium TaxID=325217 RepID=UPI0019D4E849|nr:MULTISPECIES: hypothetical protein [unclassified Mesorhizobium]
MTDQLPPINGQKRENQPPASSSCLNIDLDAISRADVSRSVLPGARKCPTGLRRSAKSWELRKAVFPPPLSARPSTEPASEAPVRHPPSTVLSTALRVRRKAIYFLAFAFAGAAFGLAAGAAFFTAAEDFAAAAFFAGAAFLAGADLAGAAFFTAGFAAAFAAGFLAGAAFALAGAALALAGAALALAGAAFFTAGFAAAFAAGFLAGAAFALAAAAFGLAAGAAFFTAVATFAAAAFAGAFFAGDFFAGDLDAGALDDCLAMSCPFRCADGH